MSFANREYFLQVDEKREGIAFSLKTVEIQNSICPLILQKIDIELPNRNKKGLLRLTVGPRPGGICLPALGHRKGKFLLERGAFLPSLPDGTYLLIINKQLYGNLFLGEDLIFRPKIKVFTYE